MSLPLPLSSSVPSSLSSPSTFIAPQYGILCSHSSHWEHTLGKTAMYIQRVRDYTRGVCTREPNQFENKHHRVYSRSECVAGLVPRLSLCLPPSPRSQSAAHAHTRTQSIKPIMRNDDKTEQCDRRTKKIEKRKKNMRRSIYSACAHGPRLI